MKKTLLCLPLVALLAACSPRSNMITVKTTTTTTTTTTTKSESQQTSMPQPEVIVSDPAAMVLKASAFKMSGNYAKNVAVTLAPDGSLIYYPAPTDISEASAPVEIGDGWWLNRQGLGSGSVFTKWTFDEYRALKSTPSPAEIKAAVIPGARVTEFRRLPVSASKAAEMSPASLLQYLK